MAGTISSQEKTQNPDARTLLLIRQKFREVFGCNATMNDETLARRYRITSEGDLIVILR